LSPASGESGDAPRALPRHDSATPKAAVLPSSILRDRGIGNSPGAAALDDNVFAQEKPARDLAGLGLLYMKSASPILAVKTAPNHGDAVAAMP
jgi:hypothetical protein